VEDGFFSKPVTVIDITENVVAKISDEKVMIGFGKITHPTKAQLGQFKELGFAPSIVKESDAAVEGLAVGVLTIAEFPKLVAAVGTSKGKGFASVIKKYRFKGKQQTHGTSDKERSPGS